GMGKCCVAGAGDVRIDYASKSFEAGGVTIREGEEISLDGSTGTVYGGSIATVEPELTGEFGTLMGWADEIRRLGVRTNADTPGDTEVAVRFGAEGIGLTRTEHMFFEGDRIVSFRRLILVADEVRILREQIDALRAERDAAKDDAKKADADARIAELRAELAPSQAQYNKALEELLPLQRGDFEGIFRALDGRPCTVRLLDPPLHEFLPHDGAGQEEMSQTMGVPVEIIKEVVEKLHEFNPMLGHRGCRLGITYPEVTEMQARGIIEAALNVKGEGIDVHPEIMVPLVGIKGELDNQEKVIREIAEKVFAERGDRIEYLVGTMIEIPRAAVTADKIAETAEFFSFGTNDLTQMGCGFSRDDAGKFLGEYVQKGIFEKDPFQVLDQEGIGEFVRIAIERGRSRVSRRPRRRSRRRRRSRARRRPRARRSRRRRARRRRPRRRHRALGASGRGADTKEGGRDASRRRLPRRWSGRVRRRRRRGRDEGGTADGTADGPRGFRGGKGGGKAGRGRGCGSGAHRRSAGRGAARGAARGGCSVARRRAGAAPRAGPGSGSCHRREGGGSSRAGLPLLDLRGGGPGRGAGCRDRDSGGRGARGDADRGDRRAGRARRAQAGREEAEEGKGQGEEGKEEGQEETEEEGQEESKEESPEEG
ncbi:MAG: putative PEP-binding protein, partial [Planctomycetota bacterium]